MGLKWQVEAAGLDQFVYRFDVGEDGYSGSVTTLTGQADFTSLTAEDEQANLDDSFRTRSPKVTVLDPNETLTDTYRAADRTHPVDVYRKASGAASYPSDPFWKGYLLSDFIERDPSLEQVPTQLRLTEGIGTLKGIAFDPSSYSGTPQEADIRQYIVDALSELGYTLPINVVQTWYPGVLNTRWGNGDQPLEYLRVLTDNFQEDRTALADESYISWYDVLRACLSAFDLVLTQSGGEWWATQRSELVGGTVQRWRYDGTGTLQSSGSVDISFDLSPVESQRRNDGFWTQRSDTHRTHDFDNGILDQLVKTSSFELQFSNSDNEWNVRRSGEVRREGYPLADKQADVNGTDSYYAELDGIEETEWQTPWQISQQLPIDIRGEGGVESVVSLDSWVSSGGSYREMRMELSTGEGFYLTEKYNQLQHTGTWDEDRNHIQIDEVQGSSDGQIMVPSGVTLKLVRGASALNALLATIELNEPLRVGDTRVVGDLSTSLDFSGDDHYLFWAAWESSQGKVTLPTPGAQWLEYTLVSRLRTPDGVRVKGVPTLRFYTQDDGSSGNRQPGYLDHVRVGLQQDGDSIGVVTGSASLTQAGETDTTGHRVGQGPTEDAIARLRAEDDTNTVWDAPDNWTSDATSESQDTLKMLHAAETLRTRRNHLEQVDVRIWPRDTSEVPEPHQVISYDNKEWTVHRFEHHPGDEGYIDFRLMELREDGNADITTQLTYGESEDDDTASSAPTASVGGSGGGASSWGELTGKPSGLLSTNGGSDGISETIAADEHIDDRANDLLTAGSGISLSYDDPGNSLTITNTGTSSTAGEFSGVEATRDTTLSVSSGSATIIDWDGELFDTDSYHSTSTNTSRLTVPNAGKYLIGGTIEFAAWATLSDGRLQVRLFKNGAFIRELIDNEVDSSGGDGPSYSFQTVVDAAQGDYFELNVLQASGGSRDLTTNSVFYASRLQGSGPSALPDLNDVDSATQTDGYIFSSGGGNYRGESATSLVGDHVSLSDLNTADHTSLSNVQPDQHHAKPTGGTGITLDTTNNEYDLSAGLSDLTDASVSGSYSGNEVLAQPDGTGDWTERTLDSVLSTAQLVTSQPSSSDQLVTQSDVSNNVNQSLSDLTDVGSAPTGTGGYVLGVTSADTADYDGVLLTDITSNHVALSDLSSAAHSSLTSINSDDHHTRPSAGAALTENANAFDYTGGLSDQSDVTLSSQSQFDIIYASTAGSYENAAPADVLSQAGITTSTPNSSGQQLVTENDVSNNVSLGLGDLTDVGGAPTGTGGYVLGVTSADTADYDGVLLTDLTSNHVALSDLSSAQHGSLSGVGSSDHHTRPSAGTALTESSNNFNYSGGLGDQSNVSLSTEAQHDILYASTAGNYENAQPESVLSQAGITTSTPNSTDNQLVTEQDVSASVSQSLSDLTDVSSAAQLDGNVIASSGGNYSEEGISSLVQDHVTIGDLPSAVARTDQAETFDGEVTFNETIHLGFSEAIADGGDPAIITDADNDQPNTHIGFYADGLPGSGSETQLAQLGTGNDTTWIADNIGLAGITAPSYAVDVNGTVNATNLRVGGSLLDLGDLDSVSTSSEAQFDILYASTAGNYENEPVENVLNQANLTTSKPNTTGQQLVTENDVNASVSQSLSDLTDVGGAPTGTGGYVLGVKSTDTGDYDGVPIADLTSNHVALSDLSSASHSSLSSINDDDHHAKPGGGTGISFDSTNNEYDLNAALGDLNDTTGVGSPSTNNVLYWNGSNWTAISPVTPLNQGGFTASTVDSNNRIATENEVGSNVSQLSDLSDVDSAAQLDGNVIASSGGNYSEEGISSLVQDHISTDDVSEGSNLYYTDTRAVSALQSHDGTNINADTLDGVQGSNYARTDQAETFNGEVTLSAGGVLSGSPFRMKYDTGLAGNKVYFQRDNATSETAITLSGTNVGLSQVTSPSYACDVSGTVNASDVRWGSDERIKSDYDPVSDPLRRVQALTGYTGKKETRDGRTAYHIAQEVEDVFPEAVDRADTEEGLYGLYSDSIPALHTEAIKALIDEVRELRKQVNG